MLLKSFGSYFFCFVLQELEKNFASTRIEALAASNAVSSTPKHESAARAADTKADHNHAPSTAAGTNSAASKAVAAANYNAAALSGLVKSLPHSASSLLAGATGGGGGSGGVATAQQRNMLAATLAAAHKNQNRNEQKKVRLTLLLFLFDCMFTGNNQHAVSRK